MRSIFTGNEAQSALDAKFLIDAGLDVVFQIQILPVHYIFCSHSTEVLDLLESLFIHPMIQSFNHVFDDSETIVHDGGANLHSLSPHGHEFRRIFPVGNTSNGRNRQAQCFRIPGNLRSHVEGNRLDCRATITSMGSFAFNAGFRAHRVKIDRYDGTDRIDQ